MTSSKALNVVDRIEQMCDFIESQAVSKAVDDNVPFTNMRRGPGALGFEVPLWVGLGIVGLWAALDAFSDRGALPKGQCPICRRKSCIQNRLASHAQPTESSSLAELEDLRHLYAHNYAGEADAEYFGTATAPRKRHVLARGLPSQLTSGGHFDGEGVQLDLPHLRAYARSARGLLRRFG
jgi:hypothetical protein